MQKSNSKFRWVILALASTMMIGNFFCYDQPSALNEQLDDYLGKPHNFEELFSLFYTLYSTPNIILPFFGGHFVDRLGVRVCLVVFIFTIALGQVLFSIGLTIKSWPLMLIGRITYGFGGESLGVANSALLSEWFKGKELAFAFGLNLSMSRVGSVANNIISPLLASSMGVPFSLWFGVLLCIVSIVSVVGIVRLDLRAPFFLYSASVRKKLRRQLVKPLMSLEDDEESGLATPENAPKTKPSLAYRPPSPDDIFGDPEETKAPIAGPGDGLPSNQPTPGTHDPHSPSDKPEDDCVSLKNFDAEEIVFNQIFKLEDYRKYLSLSSAENEGFLRNDSAVYKDGERKSCIEDVGGVCVGLSGVKSFDLSYWLILLLCVSVYGIILPFNNVASSLLLERSFFLEPPSGCRLADPNSCESDSNQPLGCPSSTFYQPPLPTNVTISGVQYLPLTGADINCEDPLWRDGCAAVFCARLDIGERTASAAMSIPYLLSAILSPIFGALVDRFGNRALVALAAPILLLIVHAMIGYTSISPVGPLIGQGIAYSSFAAVLWPAVPLVVPETLIGVAYGTLICVQNAGLALIPLTVAAIYDYHDNHYIPSVEVMFMSLAAVGVVLAILLNLYDYYFGNNLLNTAEVVANDEVKKAVSSDVRGNSGNNLREPLLAATTPEDMIEGYIKTSSQDNCTNGDVDITAIVSVNEVLSMPVSESVTVQESSAENEDNDDETVEHTVLTSDKNAVITDFTSPSKTEEGHGLSVTLSDKSMPRKKFSSSPRRSPHESNNLLLDFSDENDTVTL